MKDLPHTLGVLARKGLFFYYSQDPRICVNLSLMFIEDILGQDGIFHLLGPDDNYVLGFGFLSSEFIPLSGISLAVTPN